MNTQIKVIGPRGAGLGVGDSARSARARALQDYASRFERVAGGRKQALREGKGRFSFEVLAGGKPTRSNPPVGKLPVGVSAHSRSWPQGHAPKGPKPMDVARASIQRSLAAGQTRAAAEAEALAAVRVGSDASDKGAKIVVTRALNQTVYANQPKASKAPKAPKPKASAPKKRQPPKPPTVPAGQLSLMDSAPRLDSPETLQRGSKVIVLGLDESGLIVVAQSVKNKTAAKSVATELMPAHVRYRVVLEIHSSYRVR